MFKKQSGRLCKQQTPKVATCHHLLLTYFAGAFAPVATQLNIMLKHNVYSLFRVGGVAQLVVASSLMLKGIEFDPG